MNKFVILMISFVVIVNAQWIGLWKGDKIKWLADSTKEVGWWLFENRTGVRKSNDTTWFTGDSVITTGSFTVKGLYSTNVYDTSGYFFCKTTDTARVWYDKKYFHIKLDSSDIASGSPDTVLVHGVLKSLQGFMGTGAYDTTYIHFYDAKYTTKLGKSAGLNFNNLGVNNSYNTFVGYGCGYGSAAGVSNAASNTALGYQALYNISHGGGSNTAIGKAALFSSQDGSYNVAVGCDALWNLNKGSYNTAVGCEALIGLGWNTSDVQRYNTALGYRAGRTRVGGDLQKVHASIFIGANNGAYAENDSFEIVLGNFVKGFGKRTMLLGDTAIRRTYIYGNTNIAMTGSNDTLRLKTDSIIGKYMWLNGDLTINKGQYSSALTLRNDVGSPGDISPNLVFRTKNGTETYIRGNDDCLQMLGPGAIGALQVYSEMTSFLRDFDGIATVQVSNNNSTNNARARFRVASNKGSYIEFSTSGAHDGNGASAWIELPSGSNTFGLTRWGGSQYHSYNIAHAPGLSDYVHLWYVDSATGWSPVFAMGIRRNRQVVIPKSLVTSEVSKSALQWNVCDDYLAGGTNTPASGYVSSTSNADIYTGCKLLERDIGGNVTIDSLIVFFWQNSSGTHSVDSCMLQGVDMSSSMTWSTVRSWTAGNSSSGYGSANIVSSDYDVAENYCYRIKCSVRAASGGEVRIIGFRMVYHLE